MAQFTAAKPVKIIDFQPWENSAPKDSRSENSRLAGLLEQIAGGNQEAFAELYDLTKGLVFGLVCRILGDQGLAEEVLMDVYMQIWQQAKNYNPERGVAISWVVMLARCRAIDRKRSARYLKYEQGDLESVFDLEVEAENPEQVSLFSEKRRQVRTVLAGLSKEQREVIEIAYFGGYTQTEIADRLGIPLGTVKTRMRTGLMKMKESLIEM